MNEETVKQLVAEKVNLGASQLQVQRLDEDPEYWLVNLQDESGQPLIGAAAYVVNSDGEVFETSGSLPPSARLEAAKIWFTSN